MLLTKWGKKLDKNNPLSEYPRTQFVRDSYISLNGMWKCAFYGMPDCDDEMFRYDICVPFSPESYLSGVHRTLEPGEFLIYKRKFEIPKGFNKGRVFINFGAVDQIATVFINGAEVATHKGGYTPFKFEITLIFQILTNFHEVSRKLSVAVFGTLVKAVFGKAFGLNQPLKNSLKRLKLHPTMIIQTYRLNISEQMMLRCQSLTVIN